LKIILFFKRLKEKMWANFQRILELFTQKIESKLSKISVWDPGSEIRDPEKNLFRVPNSGSRIPDPRFRGQKGTGSESATLGSGP
jgi:hypothetical protein